ncbi:hypothetical protein JOD43_002149 [Pullulanibacillus pueri]|uniref:Uncharacterized protein n=1 Tax=Pullulanibacillus pueri TaxID=1437324 RepID=A0A8J2ZWG8_9BACL|nr:hypothetical protein [Pullulanibacillus pueri]MBM7681977.1 hypothetical protein [Pullulanibacillus pueri]GGH83647.1 hypothetical protein GCM10007096_24880 [Pullulanibacillus pueri]
MTTAAEKFNKDWFKRRAECSMDCLDRANRYRAMGNHVMADWFMHEWERCQKEVSQAIELIELEREERLLLNSIWMLWNRPIDISLNTKVLAKYFANACKSFEEVKQSQRDLIVLLNLVCEEGLDEARSRT